MNGILNLNKPTGCSSHDMVYFARRLSGEKKVGHTGTLDPLASGVLPLLMGNATKLSQILSDHDKKYRAVMKLGVSTDTMDITGNITKQSNIIPDESEVLETAKLFTGDILQTPPVYSAIKVGGKKLYEYARKGIDIKPEPRKVSIYSIGAKKINSLEYSLDIHCSKGTYIRSLCNDIGEKLKCGGVMSGLTRTASGNFSIENSFKPEELEKIKSRGKENFLQPLLISSEDVLKKIIFKRVTLDEICTKQGKNGVSIYLSKIVEYCKSEFIFNIGDKVLMYDSNGIFFALGGIREYNQELACKAEIFLPD